MQRAFTSIITTTTAVTDQKFPLTYYDQYRLIRVNGIYADVQAARFQIGCIVNGFEYARFASNLFAAGNQRVNVEFDVPLNASFQLVTQDASGTAHANMSVTVFYTVDTDK